MAALIARMRSRQVGMADRALYAPGIVGIKWVIASARLQLVAAKFRRPYPKSDLIIQSDFRDRSTAGKQDFRGGRFRTKVGDTVPCADNPGMNVFYLQIIDTDGIRGGPADGHAVLQKRFLGLALDFDNEVRDDASG
jgi:hypothetical protein